MTVNVGKYYYSNLVLVLVLPGSLDCPYLHHVFHHCDRLSSSTMIVITIMYSEIMKEVRRKMESEEYI